MINIDKAKCCGCNACEYICPKDAIVMKRDKYGFRYPYIKVKKCISCGLCEKICAFQDSKKKKVIATYAAVNLNKKQKKKSSSGGLFAVLAEKFIQAGGFVCGAELQIVDNKVNVSHCIIDNTADIYRLQGSKYVQSNLKCLLEIEDILKSGKKLLFSGTPCQVAQIEKMFFKYKEFLYTIDIICHGVPNQKWFNEYLTSLVEKNMLIDFNFRNKDHGWGHTSALCKMKKRNGKDEEKYIEQKKSSFYQYFLNCENLRESCYNCPYATMERVGDLTLGDCWGIEIFAPELLDENGGELKKNEGISCLLVNSKRGEELLKLCENSILRRNIDIQDAAIVNKQLREPSAHTKVRNDILKIYTICGYKGVEIYFKVTTRLKILKGWIWQLKHKKLKKYEL